MSKISKRLKSTGINTLVLVISIIIFVVSFMAMNALAKAQKPETTTILAASHHLDIGASITNRDITEKTVYVDDNTDLYIPADQADTLVGGTVALPMSSDQPFFRDAVFSKAGEAYRISAILQDHPKYSLFPLPLDYKNMIAPDISTFLPGDLIGLTVVIGTQPQPPKKETKTASSSVELVLTPTVAFGADLPTPMPGAALREEAEDQAYPPLAKDLFPEGAQIISIQGLPPEAASGDSADDSDSPMSTYSSTSQKQLLILLIPNEIREKLALSLQQGDQIIVSLLARSDDETTAGFTYWDFEELFRSDRAEVLDESLPAQSAETLAPSVTPTPTSDSSAVSTATETPAKTPTPTQ